MGVINIVEGISCCLPCQGVYRCLLIWQESHSHIFFEVELATEHEQLVSLGVGWAVDVTARQRKDGFHLFVLTAAPAEASSESKLYKVLFHSIHTG